MLLEWGEKAALRIAATLAKRFRDYQFCSFAPSLGLQTFHVRNGFPVRNTAARSRRVDVTYDFRPLYVTASDSRPNACRLGHANCSLLTRIREEPGLARLGVFNSNLFLPNKPSTKVWLPVVRKGHAGTVP